MANELPLYDGARRVAAQGVAVGGAQLPRVQGMGGALDAAVDAGLRVVHDYARLKDFGEAQRVESELRRNQDAMDEEFRRGMEARWGSEASFYREDGSRDDDKLAAFKEKWAERNVGIGRSYLLRESAMRGEAEVQGANDAMRRRVDAATLEGEFANRRRFFQDNYALAVVQEDWDGAGRAVDDAVAAGQITEVRGRVMKLELGRARLRKSAAAGGYGEYGSVNVGGQEYSGLSAALAMAEARGGEVRRAEQAMADDGAAPAPMAGDAADMRDVLTMMPEEEFGGVVDVFADDVRVLTQARADGGVEVSCAAYAPGCVQRAAAVGNAGGGLDEQQAKMMVARIALDAVADNPAVTTGQVVDMFARSGVYEVLGGGDADVGKERVRGIADEMVARGGGDVKKLGLQSIEPMIKAHLASREFAEGREWGRMEGLNPRLDDEDDVWDKSDLDEGERKRWFSLYDVYRKYRKEFNPDATGELGKEEFEGCAQRFYNWYKKEKLPELKRADVEAAKDWYTLRVASALREKAYVDVEGGAEYAGYGHDVQVARAVLREAVPERLGADELVAASVASQEQDARRSAAFRNAAKADYERLRGLKLEVEENEDKAKKERERKAKAEERKAEKAAREAEKQAERDAARRLFVARSTPREAAWVWDGRNAGDGAVPQCLVPEVEYKRLQEELGFDGSQVVYVQVNGARLLVTGVSRSGKLELNAPAVAKVQKKPNAKKGERWKTGGSLGYSYYFKSMEAK